MCASLTRLDLAQLEQAAKGKIYGTLEDWPELDAALRKIGLDCPLSTTASTLRGISMMYLDGWRAEGLRRWFDIPPRAS